MKSKIRLGILGGGGDSLIGIVHRIASSMHDSYSIIGGVFNPDFSENLKFAKDELFQTSYPAIKFYPVKKFCLFN